MKPHTILLVEDGPEDEFLTTKGLQSSGVPFQLTVCRNGAGAIERLRDLSQPVPGLIILDFRMPAIGGLDVLVALRAQPLTERVPVVVLSSSLSPLQVRECVDEGANCCMLKPFDSDEYVAAVSLLAQFWLNLALPMEVDGWNPSGSGLPDRGVPVPMEQTVLHPSTVGYDLSAPDIPPTA